MTGDLDIRGSASLQDVDLFSRLNQYFDVLDQHLRAGHGWFIFNAAGSRSRRIGAFILSRLAPYQPFVSTYVVPWRDFSLNAYMVEIELQTIAQREGELEGKAKTEFDIATRVSRDSMVKMVVSDLLIVTELRPTHRHELLFLDQTMERRYNQRLSTILTTPRQPQELATEFASLAPEVPFWDRLFSRMYERSLIAL
jgi:hypothetical protein